jgi:hypothetical protein
MKPGRAGTLISSIACFKEVASLCALSAYGQELCSTIAVVSIALADGIVLVVRFSYTPLLLTTPFLPIVVFKLLELVIENLLRFSQEWRVILGVGGCSA